MFSFGLDSIGILFCGGFNWNFILFNRYNHQVRKSLAVRCIISTDPDFFQTWCALLSDCLAMFDWHTELAPPIPIPMVQSQSPPSISVVRSALAAPVTDQTVPPPPKSFAAILGGASTCVAEDVPFPVPFLKGDTLSIKIGQDEDSKGLAECQYALRVRLTLIKGDKPYTECDLASKLGKIWKMVHEWKMVSLGRGFYDFLFQNPNDLTRIWAAGSVSLQPGLLRLSQWTKDFHQDSHKQTHASL